MPEISTTQRLILKLLHRGCDSLRPGVRQGDWVSWRIVCRELRTHPDHADGSNFSPEAAALEAARLINCRRDVTNRCNWVKLTPAGRTFAAVSADAELKAAAIVTARRAFQHFSDDLQQHETKIDKLEKQLTSLEAERPSMYPADFERERSAIAYHLQHSRFLADCSRSMAKQWQQTLADAEAAAGGG